MKLYNYVSPIANRDNPGVVLASKATDKVAVLRLYSIIWDWTAETFAMLLEDAVKEKKEKVTLRFNSGGGSVTAGIAMINTIKACPIPVHAYIDGVAASMAGVIAASCDEIYIAKNARLMIHKPSGSGYGQAHKLRELADLMDSMEEDLIESYVERTGKPKETVATWFLPDKDAWFTARQALDNKLVNGITEPVVKKTAPANLLNKGADQVWQFYNESLTNQSDEDTTDTKEDPDTSMDFKAQLLARFALAGITAASGDTEVLNALANHIQGLENKNKTLSDENDKLKQDIQAAEEKAAKDKAEALVDGAIAANKLQKGDREQWVKDATENYDLARRMVDKLPVFKSPTGAIRQGLEEEEEEQRPGGGVSARLLDIRKRNNNGK